MCKKCLLYGHSVKNCKKDQQVCKRCSLIGHNCDKCEIEQLKCIHCNGAHVAGSKECPKYQKEEMLLEIQEREKVTIMRARQILKTITNMLRDSKILAHFTSTAP